jgi:PII-like signaling protein
MKRYKLLKIVVGEDAVYKGKSLYVALVARLKELGAAGATVTRGIEGYGKSGRIHTERILDLSADLPVTIEVVDTPGKIEEVLPEIKKIAAKGLVFTADVDVMQ